MKKILLCCCLAALFASCEELLNSEPVTGDPIYSAGILYGTAIENADDLKKIGKDEYPDWPLDGDYYLAADIDLAAVPEADEPEDPEEGEPAEAAETAWTPIGPDADNAFTGTFNGNGKTISGLKLSAGEDGTNVYTGLFGYLNMAQIKNLTVELANPLDEPVALSASVAQYIGVLAGYASYSDISNVTIRAAEGCGLYNVKSNGSTIGYAGGLIGYIKVNTTITNSKVDLNLKSDTATTGAQYSGLVIGYSGNPVTLRNCTAEGSVEVKKTGTAGGAIYAGGIAGYGDILEKCESRVTKVIAETAGTGAPYAGGIAGDIYIITSCSLLSAAEITAVSTNTNSGSGNVYAGGLIGNMTTGGISHSSVTGAANIRAESAGKQHVYAGGIVGKSTVYVKNSYVSGGVTALAKSTNTGNGSFAVAAGGIGGYVKTISNCYSAAAVSIDTKFKSVNTAANRTGAGRLAGIVPSAGAIEESYATGSVTINSSHAENIVYAGGLAGVIGNASGAVTIKNSVALNGAIRIQSGTAAVYANRIIGNAYNNSNAELVPVQGNTILAFSNLYASSGMTIQKKINDGDWQAIDQSTNDAGGFTGSANFDRDQNFFQSLPDWDFTGPGGARPPVWDWDDELNLPVLHGN